MVWQKLCEWFKRYQISFKELIIIKIIVNLEYKVKTLVFELGTDFVLPLSQQQQ